MPSAAALRLQIEVALSDRIPSALTPVARLLREVMPTGVAAVDELLHGGLPVGVVTEMTGAECCGRTSLALSFVAGVTRAERVCAWVDGSDGLSPESAAAAGVDLRRLLWVRCGVSAVGKALAAGAGGRGLSIAVRRPWTRIEQALRVTDLLLQAGGFSAIVLDMGGIAQEHVSRVPLATWFRYRAAAERTHACVLLLTQHACAKSSAGLALRLGTGGALSDGSTVFAGCEHSVEVSRQRFAEGAAPEHAQERGSNVVPLRKLPQRVSGASWQSRTAWAGWR